MKVSNADKIALVERELAELKGRAEWTAETHPSRAGMWDQDIAIWESILDDICRRVPVEN